MLVETAQTRVLEQICFDLDGFQKEVILAEVAFVELAAFFAVFELRQTRQALPVLQIEVGRAALLDEDMGGGVEDADGQSQGKAEDHRDVGVVVLEFLHEDSLCLLQLLHVLTFEQLLVLDLPFSDGRFQRLGSVVFAAYVRIHTFTAVSIMLIFVFLDADPSFAAQRILAVLVQKLGQKQFAEQVEEVQDREGDVRRIQRSLVLVELRVVVELHEHERGALREEFESVAENHLKVQLLLVRQEPEESRVGDDPEEKVADQKLQRKALHLQLSLPIFFALVVLWIFLY